MIAVDTNLLGVLLCTRRASAAMLGAGVDGDLVFITSDSVHKPYPHMLTYGATKAAVEYLAAWRRSSTSSWPAPASARRSSAWARR